MIYIYIYITIGGAGRDCWSKNSEHDGTVSHNDLLVSPQLWPVSILFHHEPGRDSVPLWQTPHLKSNSARVRNTTRQLTAPHHLPRHPCRSSDPPPHPPLPPLLFYFNLFSPAPSCSNTPPNIIICQSNKHYQAVDITSFCFLAIHAVAPIHSPPPPSP